MTPLSNIQTLILTAATERETRIALPLPETLRGGAAARVVGAMLAKGLIEEVDADRHKNDPVWLETGDGHAVTLIATDAGLAAIGIEPEHAQAELPKTPTLREGTKQATLIAMLRAPEGATVEEIVAALDWQAHTARGAISGALKKKLGLTITSQKVEGRGRCYHIA